MTGGRQRRRIHLDAAALRDPVAMDALDPQPFACPRCAAQVTETYFGPCSGCRSQLRATLGGEQRDVATSAYVPKMNVTPTAVATKD